MGVALLVLARRHPYLVPLYMDIERSVEHNLDQNFGRGGTSACSMRKRRLTGSYLAKLGVGPGMGVIPGLRIGHREQ